MISIRRRPTRPPTLRRTSFLISGSPCCGRSGRVTGASPITCNRCTSLGTFMSQLGFLDPVTWRYVSSSALLSESFQYPRRYSQGQIGTLFQPSGCLSLATSISGQYSSSPSVPMLYPCGRGTSLLLSGSFRQRTFLLRHWSLLASAWPSVCSCGRFSSTSSTDSCSTLTS